MSYTRQGSLTEGTYQVSPGSTTNFSRTGLSQRDEVWVMNTNDVFTLSPRPNITKHPTIPNLLCTSSIATDGRNGLSSVSIKYEGFAEGSGGQPLPPPVYSLSGVPFTAPIDTIEPEKWEAVKSYIENNYGSAELAKAFKDGDVSGRFEQFTNNVGRYSGGSEYEDGHLYWQVDYLARSSQRGKLSRYQLIDDPMGSAPKVGKRNWRLVSFNERDLGNVYEVSLGYLQSGPNGHDPIIYG